MNPQDMYALAYISLVFELRCQYRSYMFDTANLDELSKAVRQRRRDLGLAQQDVADATGVQRQTVGRIEAGNREVSIGIWLSVTNVLGLDLVAIERRPS